MRFLYLLLFLLSSKSFNLLQSLAQFSWINLTAIDYYLNCSLNNVIMFRAQELLGDNASSVKLQLLGDFHPEVVIL